MTKKEKFLVPQAAIDRCTELNKNGVRAWWYRDQIGIWVEYEA